MKKHFTLLLFYSLVSHGLLGQATLTNSRFVEAGDHLSYYHNTTDTVWYGEPADNEQFWDFSHLSGAEVWTDTFLAATVGDFTDEFPSANILQRSTNGREEYLEVNSAAILSNGYVQSLLGELFPVR